MKVVIGSNNLYMRRDCMSDVIMIIQHLGGESKGNLSDLIILPEHRGWSFKSSKMVKFAKMVSANHNSQHGRLNKVRGGSRINKVSLGTGMSLNDVTL